MSEVVKFGVVVWDPNEGVRWWKQPAGQSQALCALAMEDWWGQTHLSLERRGQGTSNREQRQRSVWPICILPRRGELTGIQRKECIVDALSDRLHSERRARELSDQQDRILEAMGLDATHHLVLDKDVADLVEAVEALPKGNAAAKVLARLRGEKNDL